MVFFIRIFLSTMPSLLQSDISGMSNAIEVRSPFLDHKLVEFAFSLPTLPIKMKLKGLHKEKHILYKAGASFLPASVINRKKMSYGAGIPYQRWFFSDWMPFVKEMIFDRRISEMYIFDLLYIEKLMTRTNCDSSLNSYGGYYALVSGCIIRIRRI